MFGETHDNRIGLKKHSKLRVLVIGFSCNNGSTLFIIKIHSYFLIYVKEVFEDRVLYIVLVKGCSEKV